MVICQPTGPSATDGWPTPVLQLETVEAMPPELLEAECPDWRESVVEKSFLRRPDVLAKALGVPMPQELLVLKQVARIDLYLRTQSNLHLLEVKRPTQYGEWRAAADQIARQWAQASHWLRRGHEHVLLWGVCPVRWSRSRRSPKVPENWASELAAIKANRLGGSAAAALGLLFYSFFRSSNGSILLLWRADEPVPSVRTLEH